MIQIQVIQQIQRFFYFFKCIAVTKLFMIKFHITYNVYHPSLVHIAYHQCPQFPSHNPLYRWGSLLLFFPSDTPTSLSQEHIFYFSITLSLPLFFFLTLQCSLHYSSWRETILLMKRISLYPLLAPSVCLEWSILTTIVIMTLLYSNYAPLLEVRIFLCEIHQFTLSLS